MQVWWSRVVAKVPLLGSRELMLRIAGTLGLLTFIRLGLFIALPGLIPELDMQQAARTCKSSSCGFEGCYAIVSALSHKHMDTWAQMHTPHACMRGCACACAFFSDDLLQLPVLTANAGK